MGDDAYLEHCKEDLKSFLHACPSGNIVFVPYAGNNFDTYATTAKEFFTKLDPAFGDAFISLHESANPKQTITSQPIKAIFIAGGNTFKLLKTLQDKDLLQVINQKVRNGAGYMAVSAGTNVACPTIMTTNDMPIVTPKDFNALGLVDFQINAHFLPGAFAVGHRGETREERITEYHEENDLTVVGLPEASWITTIDHDDLILCGGNDAVIFNKGQATTPWQVGTKLPLRKRA